MQIPATAYLKLLILLVVAAGCATKQYASMDPASIPLGQMNVSVGEGWLRVPEVDTPEKRSLSRTFSRDNLQRDRLMLIAGIRLGESIFRIAGAMTLPTFEAHKDLQQIADMIGESMQKRLWDGGAKVTVSNTRGHGYLGKSGFQFDIDVDMPSGQNHKGFAGGFVHEERLYVNIFVAEAPDHFSETKESAQQVIDSASVRVKTIRMN